MGSKPYETGALACRSHGMVDSAKYPGLCKQYDENQVERNVDNEYADLEFNSINDREGDAAQHYTYKTYNGEYENKRRNNANNGFGPYVNRANYNRISNNEVHSFVKRHQQSQVSRQQQQQQQQQYATNGASSFPQQQKLNQQQPNYQSNQQTSSFQPMTPFLQAYQLQQQQHTQKRPIDRSNPFQTYRWDQLFKNHV